MFSQKKLFFSLLIFGSLVLFSILIFLTNNWTYLPYKMEPVLFSLGPLRVHWYGLMYVFAFLTSYGLVIYRLRKEKWEIKPEVINDFLNWLILGVLLGGRLGYVLFYKPIYFLNHPLEIFLPFQFDGKQWFFGIYGMSFHGGLLGVVLAFFLFCRKRKINVWKLSDLIVPAIPLGYAFGRLGNFINGELFGRVTSVPWGMHFPADPYHLRHPSQIYEMFLEGILLFIFLWSVRNVKFFQGRLFSAYLIGYGAARFIAEFFREPDLHLGYIANMVTMGQILSLIMIFTGFLLFNKNKFDKKSNK